jgi:ABC-type antimicrobial peptide transport system permease subunit
VIGGGIVFVATVVAALLPSFRAGRVNPSHALRAE